MKINFNIEDRSKFIYYIIIAFFLILFFRASYLTIVEGESYSSIAENKIYKNIVIEAPRGEIRDRNGTLLAGNRPLYSIQIYPNEINTKEINEVIQKVVKILEDSNESIVDEFPIIMTENGYEFTYDKKVADWKQRSEIPQSFDAKQTYDYIIETLTENEIITILPDDTIYEIQTKIIDAGYFPPISVDKMEFTELVRKSDWLTNYLKRYIKDEEERNNVSPKEAFSLIRQFYTIDATLTDTEARKIIAVRDLIRSKGYYQYEPTTVAEDISIEAVSKIEESSLNLPGVSVKVGSVRYYPQGQHSSHILGQLGKISSQAEIDKYVKENGYYQSDIIGKTGIEKAYEDQLKGTNGYTKVQVDVGGRLLETIERKEPEIGDTVYLTMDSKLQKVAEDSLAKTLKTIQEGGTYQSVWGDMRMRDNIKAYTKATSGAVVALDVNTGEILALASYPDYDPNLFVQGISTDDLNSLIPANLNDSLAPKPLYNIATMTSVQPGSTFKMLTGLAAIEAGLDPYFAIMDKGFISLGGRTFGCWIWNQRGGNHGFENLMDALRDSCNYYFYCVSVGYNYATNTPLPIKMEAEDVLNYAKMFGLDDRTGIQIEEIPGKVPNPESKAKTLLTRLETDLTNRMKTYFEEFDNTSPRYKSSINTILSWMDENPTRGEIINRLTNLGVKPKHIEEVADLVKYSYFNQATWHTGDTFNLSIGQGEHAYTPLQMANFVAALANGGYLNKVTVVDKVESSDKSQSSVEERVSTKIPLKDPKNLDYIRKGMEDVTDEGTAASYFRNFPISIASKTGTAQKSGKIPTADEEEYLLKYMSNFGVNKNQVLELATKLQKEDESKYSYHVYMRRAILELNPNMTSEKLNAYKDSYDPFAWFVSYAPADKPEIAVVTLLFQGGHGGYGAAIARDIFAEYFNLLDIQTVDEPFTLNDKIG